MFKSSNLLSTVALVLGIAVAWKTLFPKQSTTGNAISDAVNELTGGSADATIGTRVHDGVQGVQDFFNNLFNGTGKGGVVVPNPVAVLSAGGDFDDGSGGQDFGSSLDPPSDAQIARNAPTLGTRIFDLFN